MYPIEVDTGTLTMKIGTMTVIIRTVTIARAAMAEIVETVIAIIALAEIVEANAIITTMNDHRQCPL